jgi:hypothetical protein
VAEQWFVARGKQKAGPYSSAELKEMARTGGLLPIDMVLEEGTQQWRRASEIEGLFWVSVPSATGPDTHPPPLPPTSTTSDGIDVSGSSSPPPPPLNLPPVGQAQPEREKEVQPAEQPAPAPAPTAAIPEGIEDTAQTLPWAIDFEETGGETLPTPTVTPPAPREPEDLTAPVLSSPPATSSSLPAQTPAQPPLASACLTASHEASEPTVPPRTPAALSPSQASAEEDSGENPVKTTEATGTGQRLVKWIVATACLAGLLGLAGDFLQPLAPLNLIAFAATSGLALVLLVLWVKRREALGSAVGLACVILGCLATGFGGWWALAHFKGGQEKGYLAARFRFVGRVQSATLSKVEGEELMGVWVPVTPEGELRFKEGRMTWLIPFPPSGSSVRIDAEYGTTKDSLLHGIITRIDYGETTGRVKETLPEEDDTFSFRFRVDGDQLTVKDIRGKGFEELKKGAQGQYKRKAESPGTD